MVSEKRAGARHVRADRRAMKMSPGKADEKERKRFRMYHSAGGDAEEGGASDQRFGCTDTLNGRYGAGKDAIPPSSRHCRNHSPEAGRTPCTRHVLWRTFPMDKEILLRLVQPHRTEHNCTRQWACSGLPPPKVRDKASGGYQEHAH